MLDSARRILALATPQAVIFSVTILVFDVLGYYLLPDTIAFKFYDYRMERSVVGERTPYSRDYFVPHLTRGFDLGSTGTAKHGIPELSYPVWSNDIGCFDRTWDPVPSGYVYFAGDSFTWGYAAFEDKFATLFEMATGKPSLKCGVTGTGTRHQFDKFREVLGRVRQTPAHVIVSFFTNDIEDDHLFPDKTVVDGWLVQQRFIGFDGGPVQVDETWIRERIADSKPNLKLACAPDIWTKIKCISITANTINAIRKSIVGRDTRVGEPQVNSFTYRGRELKSREIYGNADITNGHLAYATNPRAEANRKVVLAWRQHAEQFGYRLSFILIPPAHHYVNTRLFAEVTAFLDAAGIEFLDLTRTFAEGSTSGNVLYWRYDPHFTPLGNRVVAEALVRRWGQ